ncbi:hypothetical protein AWZ03_013825 [Drosophila navojoa]|uniref:Uncharacterized protein n=1 Tax=Drosophila navojoa TaxID=7232 RepID=A0A484ATK9_DRONA|nr:hypothetical protein AWZ03_013825 [Drosophila navojoa]
MQQKVQTQPSTSKFFCSLDLFLLVFKDQSCVADLAVAAVLPAAEAALDLMCADPAMPQAPASAAAAAVLSGLVAAAAAAVAPPAKNLLCV